MKRSVSVLLLLCFSLGSTAQEVAPDASDLAVSAEDKGWAIAVEADRRDRGFGDSATELTMVLTNAEGRERTRRLSWKTLEVNEPGEGDKSLTVFYEPKDIEGTAFLSYTHTDRDDDQWLYLPSLKRVKRIAAANKSSAFMGSEFAYEDLLSDEVEKFDYRWLQDDPCGEWQCFVIERRPRYEHSGYTRQILWLDQSEYRPVKTEFFDRKDRLQKTLKYQDYHLYQERFWRAHQMRMENHQTGKTTVLSFVPFEFQTGLTAQDFEPAMLRRLR